MNQPNNKIYICSAMFFNKNLIENKYFDYNESVFWLYYFSKILLSMSLPNFYELIAFNNQNKLDKYFQPRFILNS